jgi:hypothetical protein
MFGVTLPAKVASNANLKRPHASHLRMLSDVLLRPRGLPTCSNLVLLGSPKPLSFLLNLCI